MTLRHALFGLLCSVILLTGCAEEDPNIVNPVPGGRRITMRLYNLVPDGQQRRLVMEEGFASGRVPMFAFGDTVQSPGDSTLIEILRDNDVEFRSARRVPFIPNTPYNLYAVSGRSKPQDFDTVLFANASTTASARGFAQLRLLNMHPDASRSYELRLGCPSGPLLVSVPVLHRQTSQFTEVYPSNTVLSLIEHKAGLTTVLGTFETPLKERRTYSLVVHAAETGDSPGLMFVEESDLSSNALRTFTPVASRTADVRVVNLGSSAVDADMPELSVSLAKGLDGRRISERVAVTTCQTSVPDKVRVRFASGSSLLDSTSLVVRDVFSVITADSGASGMMVVAPTIQRPIGSAGKAVVRVVHVAATTPNVRVSTSTRSSATAIGGIEPAITLAQRLGVRGISAPVTLDPGPMPITITSESTPTRILRLSTVNIEPDRSYDLILHERLGELQVAIVEQDASNSSVGNTQDASLVTLVNGAVGREQVSFRLGSAVTNGRLFFGNTVATCLEQADDRFEIDGTQGQIVMRNADRTLMVYSLPNGKPEVFQFRTLPLVPQAGRTVRRVVNATQDIPRLTVSVDSIATSELADVLARDVPIGGVSEPMISRQDRRGTYYFFDTETRNRIYTLPVQLATLGNNFTLIVIGEKSKGYDVIVMQEI
ncbi:MAG: DUF4397 domain-containing protein [Candidatus Kapabacteria bacterium]|nr:DUF4397 domain-containing protein [Candidatus Kapabacteria bacterium]